MTEDASRLCDNAFDGGMLTVVYVDVLLFINIIINYAVLITAEKLMKRQTALWRLIAASAVGSLFSLLVFTGVDSGVFSFVIKAASSLLTVLIAFPIVSRAEYLKTTLAAVGVGIVYSGFFILFYQLFKPSNMLIVNDIVYFEFNPLILLASTGAIYLLMTLFQKLFRERIKASTVNLKYTALSREYTCIAKIDTGCDLTEPFSSAPVIVADSSVMTIPDDCPKRVIPYSAVDSTSILYGVRADSVFIDGKPIDREIYIAAAPLNSKRFQAIINSEIIR